MTQAPMLPRNVSARHLALAALSLMLAPMLAACTPTQDDSEYVGGLIEMTDQDYISTTGFPGEAVSVWGGRDLADGTRLQRVQFDPSLVTAEQIAAAPAILCAGVGLSLLSSQVRAPDADDLDIPGTKVVAAICK